MATDEELQQLAAQAPVTQLDDNGQPIAPAPGAQPAAPAAPFNAGDLPMARQIADGSAQVAPGTSLGAEGPVFTAADAGAAARILPPDVAPAAVSAPGTVLPTQLDGTPAGVPVTVPPPPPVKAGGVDTRALDQARKSAYGVADAQAGQGKAEAEDLKNQADAQSKLADVQRDQAVDVQAEVQAQKDGLADARRLADEAHAEANKPEVGYWASKSTGTKVASALFVLLSGIGKGLEMRLNPNAKNMALEAIDANIAADAEDKRRNLLKKENFAAYRDRGVVNLAQQYKDDLAKIQLQQGLQYKAVADQAQAMLLAQKVPLAEAQNNVLVQTWRAKGDEQYAQGFQQLVRDKAQMALEKARLGATYAGLAESRREHDIQEGARRDKAAEADDARTVQLDDGSALKLPTARAVPEFSKGYNSRIQAAQKIKALEDDIRDNNSVYLPDAVARRQALIHDANIAVGSISSMGASDHSAHLELGTLGPGGVRTLPWEASPEVALKLLEEKRKQIDEGTSRTIATMRKDRGAAETAPDATKPATKSETKPAAKALTRDDKIAALRAKGIVK